MDQGLVSGINSAGLMREEWPEYRLVIPADEPVSRQVKQLRMQWEQLYGEASVSDKPPCITLACFVAREEMEDMLMRWIHRICSIQPSFMVTLNNFSAVPSTDHLYQGAGFHTIYTISQPAQAAG